MIRFNAHFDGKHLCPLHVTVDEAAESPASRQSRNPAKLFDELEAECGLIDGPRDWAAEHDHYLYGATKKTNGPAE